MALFQTTTGSEISADAFLKVHAMVVSRDGTTAFLGGNSSVALRIGTRAVEGALAGIKQEIGGRWFFETLEINDGTILMLAASRRRGYSRLLENASLLLRVRDNGPLMRFTIATMRLPGRSRFQEVCSTGRCDLLTYEQAQGLLTQPFPESMRRRFALNQANLITQTQLEAALSLPPVVTTRTVPVDSTAGEPARIIRVQRRRRKL